MYNELLLGSRVRKDSDLFGSGVQAVHHPRGILLLCSMATCSRVAVMDSLRGVATMQLKDLWSLGFRVLTKLLDLPPRLLKRFLADERVHPMSPMETGTSPWPELPQDMLMDIFVSLEVPDLMRAASVCSSWRSAYKSLRNLGQSKPQTPCLLYTSESAGQNVACLYCLTEQRVYKLTLPEPPLRSRMFIGSSNGWLITADERSELHLVNPITGEQIALPPVATIEHVKPITNCLGVIHGYELSCHTVYHLTLRWGNMNMESSFHSLEDLREHLYYRAYMFPDLYTGSYIVVLIHNPFRQLSFARAGDDCWTRISADTHCRDCTYADGLLYALTSLGEIHIFDLTTSVVTKKITIDQLEEFHGENMYIIQAPWGDLLQVWRTVNVPEQVDENGDILPPCTLKIHIYKVDLEAKKLTEIKGLPDHMLFLGYTNSLFLSAEEHPQLKANRVYFTDSYSELILAVKGDPLDIRDIGVLNLETGSTQEIVSPIWSNRPCPTWITPNFTKLDMVFGK